MTGKRSGQKGPRGEYEEPFLLGMDADEALERFSGVSTEEANAITVLVKDDKTIDGLMRAFEAAAQLPDTLDGQEYWFARDLQHLLAYDQWRRFADVIERAKVACQQAGQRVEDHFADVGKMVKIGSDAEREISDIALSRYAAYLVAQNADGRKTPVAFAQTYFATQTRRQELADQAPELSYDEKRVLLRSKLKEHNKSLIQAAKTAGVTNFANFNGAGLKGLYGGLNKAQVVRRKGLPPGSDHLDYAGHEELAANYFKATQAEAKIRREMEAKGEEIGQRRSESIHRNVGETVHETITGLGNTPPEDSAAEDHIREAQKRVKASQPKAIAAPKAAKKATKPKKKG